MIDVLFLCSGNYYRSRFAEAVFNHRAAERGMPWRAESRGFRLHPQNVGPISCHALEGLGSLGITLGEPLRHPRVAEHRDLEAARHVIALKEAEHRPMVEQWFPEWLSRIEFWDIHDIDCAESEQALPVLAHRIDRLLARLSARP